MLASQLFGHCHVINSRLWRHQQHVNWASETWGRCVEIVVFIVVCEFVMSCKKQNNVCTLVTNCLCSHSSVIFVFISLAAASTRQINPQITLFWALKQFEYILYYKYLPRPAVNIAVNKFRNKPLTQWGIVKCYASVNVATSLLNIKNYAINQNMCDSVWSL